MTDKKRLLIIDSNALLHRAFHALPPLITKKGEQTGAIYGFLLILFRAIKDLNPDYIVACFDVAALTFRHQKFEGYKAKRPKTPEEIKTQLPKIKEVLKVFEVPIFEKEGFEADDLIATISTRAEKENNQLETYILSGDFDTLQLVDKNTKVYTMGKGIKETVVYDEEKILSRFGVKPEQMVDFKALTGDPSDNISGVSGVGKKTAANLLKNYGSLDDLYQKIDPSSSSAKRDTTGQGKNEADIKPRIKETLLKNKTQAFFARTLIEVKKDVDINFNIKECQFGNFNQKKVENILSEFEFHSLINRLSSLRSASTKPIKSVLAILKPSIIAPPLPIASLNSVSIKKASWLISSIRPDSRDFAANSREATSSSTFFCRDCLYKYAPPHNPRAIKKIRPEIKSPMPRPLRR